MFKPVECVPNQSVRYLFCSAHVFRTRECTVVMNSVILSSLISKQLNRMIVVVIDRKTNLSISIPIIYFTFWSKVLFMFISF